MAKVGDTKYGPKGLYTKASFQNYRLPENLRKALAEAANYSLAKGTWCSYRAVVNILEKFQNELKLRFRLPMNTASVLTFIGWLIKRKLKASTINSYISGLRQVHLAKIYDEPSLRPAIVSSVIEGRSHIDKVKERLGGRCIRLPVTLNIMKLIKATLNRSNDSYGVIRLIWAICTKAFSGGFRIHELLSRLENSYDPAFTLLTSDVKVARVKIGNKPVEVLQVRVKSPKEDRIGKDIIVDVYESGGFACPVRAFKKWKETKLTS